MCVGASVSVGFTRRSWLGLLCLAAKARCRSFAGLIHSLTLARPRCAALTCGHRFVFPALARSCVQHTPGKINPSTTLRTVNQALTLGSICKKPGWIELKNSFSLRFFPVRGRKCLLVFHSQGSFNRICSKAIQLFCLRRPRFRPWKARDASSLAPIASRLLLCVVSLSSFARLTTTASLVNEEIPIPLESPIMTRVLAQNLKCSQAALWCFAGIWAQ